MISCSSVENNGAHCIELKIIDTASGIPPEFLPNLFKKFVSKDADGNATQGTGLGLFISKFIIEAHGGTISAARNKDRGTIITFILPMKSGHQVINRIL